LRATIKLHTARESYGGARSCSAPLCVLLPSVCALLHSETHPHTHAHTHIHTHTRRAHTYVPARGGGPGRTRATVPFGTARPRRLWWATMGGKAGDQRRTTTCVSERVVVGAEYGCECVHSSNVLIAVACPFAQQPSSTGWRWLGCLVFKKGWRRSEQVIGESRSRRQRGGGCIVCDLSEREGGALKARKGGSHADGLASPTNRRVEVCRSRLHRVRQSRISAAARPCGG
jgi:hypothetical protein